jgi:hypothetical protein
VKIKVGLVISVIVTGEKIRVVGASPRVFKTHSQSKFFLARLRKCSSTTSYLNS